MISVSRKILAGCAVAAAFAFGSGARAGVDISFGASAPLGDDGRLFFSISSHYFDRDPRVVDDWGRRIPDPDDLAVFLHICSHSRTSPDVVFSYRKQGLSWFDIGVRVGVPVDTWYVAVPTDPGPPYGKAYGYWRKHQRDPHYAVRLTDRQCRDLVAVRMAHDYYGVSPQVAMDWRRSGASVDTIMSREYRQRHGRDATEHHGGGRDGDGHGGKNHGHGGNGHGHGGNGHD